MRKELTNALTHESQVCRDSEVLSHQEVAQLRGLVAAQQEELRSINSDCADLQRRSASTEAELQRRSTHEEHALYQRFDDAIKEKDAQVHALQLADTVVFLNASPEWKGCSNCPCHAKGCWLEFAYELSSRINREAR